MQYLTCFFQNLLIKSLRQNSCVFGIHCLMLLFGYLLVGKKEYLNCMYVHNPELHALSYFSNFVLLEGFCFSEIVV